MGMRQSITLNSLKRLDLKFYTAVFADLLINLRLSNSVLLERRTSTSYLRV